MTDSLSELPRPLYGLFPHNWDSAPFRRISRTDHRCWFPCKPGNPRSPRTPGICVVRVPSDAPFCTSMIQ